MNQEKLNRMQNSVRIGGKGSVRRKKKTVHKKTGASDQKLNQTLRKLGTNGMPGIEEVNMFHQDGTITHFQQPKVQFSGHLESLRKMADMYQQGMMGGYVPDLADDDVPELAADDVPELVEETKDDVPELVEEKAEEKA